MTIMRLTACQYAWMEALRMKDLHSAVVTQLCEKIVMEKSYPRQQCRPCYLEVGQVLGFGNCFASICRCLFPLGPLPESFHYPRFPSSFQTEYPGQRERWSSLADIAAHPAQTAPQHTERMQSERGV